MTMDPLAQDAIDAFIEADRLMDAFPEDQRKAMRALVSGLVGLTTLIIEEHRRRESLRPTVAPWPVSGIVMPPMGME
jgi:hypothetical protein